MLKRFHDVIVISKFWKSMHITKHPRKGAVEETLIGNLNLIKLSFDSRNLTRKLNSQSFEEFLPAKEENECTRPIVSEFF